MEHYLSKRILYACIAFLFAAVEGSVDVLDTFRYFFFELCCEQLLIWVGIFYISNSPRNIPLFVSLLLLQFGFTAVYKIDQLKVEMSSML